MTDTPHDGGEHERDSTDQSPLGDVFMGAAFILFAALMFTGALFFSYRTHMGFVTAAAFTPIVLSIIVTILSATLIVTSLREPGMERVGSWFRRVAAEERTRRSAILAGITALYILTVGRIDFLLANFVFLVVMYRYLEVGSIVRVLLLGAINAGIVGFVVPRIFQLPLP